MTLKILAAFLFSISVYLGWWSFSKGSLLWLFPTFTASITSLGLFFNKPWSQYLWHIIAIAASILWLASIVRISMSGWPYESLLSSIISLIPGLSVLVICMGGSAIVFKHFRSNKNSL